MNRNILNALGAGDFFRFGKTHGLRRYGFNHEADILTKWTITELQKMYLKHGVLFEFYNDRDEVPPPKSLRKGKNIPDSFHQALHDFGWTASLCIDMIFHNIKQPVNL